MLSSNTLRIAENQEWLVLPMYLHLNYQSLYNVLECCINLGEEILFAFLGSAHEVRRKLYSICRCPTRLGILIINLKRAETPNSLEFPLTLLSLTKVLSVVDEVGRIMPPKRCPLPSACNLYILQYMAKETLQTGLRSL